MVTVENSIKAIEELDSEHEALYELSMRLAEEYLSEAKAIKGMINTFISVSKDKRANSFSVAWFATGMRKSADGAVRYKQKLVKGRGSFRYPASTFKMLPTPLRSIASAYEDKLAIIRNLKTSNRATARRIKEHMNLLNRNVEILKKPRQSDFDAQNRMEADAVEISPIE